MMDIGDVKKVIDNVAQKPFLCSDTEIETQNEYIITTKAHYEELLIAKGKETPCRVSQREDGLHELLYAEQQTSMDITTAISADRDWDGKTRYKSREIKESRNAKRETAEQKEI